jgi:lipopolysaccharide transport system ATP-binding protein
MGNVAIRTERLTKTYQLGGEHAYGHDTLRETLSGLAAAPLRALRGQRPPKEPSSVLQAVSDLSLEIREGEVAGIIGNNGAGKSTLLKILSGITEPTSGFAETTGRVGSLLEVGTGFHPELTGRENVFLNGAVLGMRQSEIRRQFDEIVAFADVERFLDTPVKRYSSGMYVRLAFAVAAHLRTEILIVDEVLAVGDAAFQRKCLGRMDDVAREGRTVLFVSHNMAVIQSLCQRGIFLSSGRLVADGPVDDVVALYLRSLEQAMSFDLAERKDRRGWQEIRVARLEISGEEEAVVSTGRPAQFTVDLTGLQPSTTVALTVLDDLGRPVARFDSGNVASSDVTVPHPAGEDAPARFVCRIPELPLLPGRYRVDVSVRGTHNLQDEVGGAAMFDVESGVLAGRPVSLSGGGTVAVAHEWQAAHVEESQVLSSAARISS